MTLKGMASYLFAFDLSMKPIWNDKRDEYQTLNNEHTYKNIYIQLNW